ncbi:MAG TPA: multidrug effflux MFS transporter [Candidatus Limnocylindrales bacterium]
MAPAGGPERTRGATVRLIVVLGALSAFAPLAIDMYLPALPALTTDLHGSASEIQLTLTACFVGLALGQIVAGPLSDAYGRRRPLLVGLAAFAVASLLCAAAPSVAALIVLRVVQGAAGAAGIVISRAVVRDLFSGIELARFYALTMIVNGAAPILAPIVGGLVLLVTSWHGTFVVLAAIGVVLFLTAALGLPESLPPAARRRGGVGATVRTFREVAGDRMFVGYALAGGLALAAMFAYIAGSPFVVETLYGASPQVFSLIFATNALGIVLAGQISAISVTRLGPQRLVVVGLATSLTGALVLLGAVVAGVGLIGILPGFFLVTSSIGLILPNATALALADHGHRAGSALALLGALQYVVGALVAPIVGIAGTGTALPMAIVVAILSLGAVAAYLGLARSPARGPAAA